MFVQLLVQVLAVVLRAAVRAGLVHGHCVRPFGAGVHVAFSARGGLRTAIGFAALHRMAGFAACLVEILVVGAVFGGVTAHRCRHRRSHHGARNGSLALFAAAALLGQIFSFQALVFGQGAVPGVNIAVQLAQAHRHQGARDQQAQDKHQQRGAPPRQAQGHQTKVDGQNQENQGHRQRHDRGQQQHHP